MSSSNGILKALQTRPNGKIVAQTLIGQIPPGESGNLRTVTLMQQVARARAKDPVIRDCAKEIIRNSKVKDMNYLGEALAIAHWVRHHVRYVRDMAGVEQLHDPLTMLDMIRRGVAQGDCDDVALLIATLLTSVGHSPYFRIIKYDATAPNYSHIYVVVYERNYRDAKKRLVLDGIIKDKDLGYEVPHAVGKEIRV